ncbi:hypothetical protein KGQ19_45245 [Catenulispora sp. NL8]|uniref:Uncharacterized protein n=1 Tax=Catenulispora pinistramenti TaxID=2705254 RepID=A0ABS5L6X2_9ACTN|nr:hypothetical protein [Catenulispora pinistramenti]MBS2554083.1 hypothetical protein [Catenulispora pinistramenti]
MSMLLESVPARVSEIEFGSLVLIGATWRRLERWETTGGDGGNPTSWWVFWAGPLLPSMYVAEPSFMQVWCGDDAPRTSGVVW